MMRTLTLLPLTFVAFLMMAAPAAVAQGDEKPAEPQDGGNAWSEDCPPDAYCMYGSGGGRPAPCDDADNATTEDCPTYSGDCGGEVCAYGGEDCIECSGPVDGGSTCMDGQQEGETCRDDVQYLGGGRGPADCENCRGDAVDADTISAPADAEGAAKNTVPGAALVGTLAALGLAGLALRRR